MKYYWFVYSHKNAGGTISTFENTSNEYPFIEVNKIASIPGGREAMVTLLNWKEISKKEFDLFKKINR